MRRVWPFLGALTLLGAACGPGAVEVASVDRRDLGFILQVVDAAGDAGSGMTMTGDADGNPHFSYLVFDPPPEEGQPPPGIQVGVPLRPTVMHSHFVGGAWTRSPVAEEAEITRGEDETAIAVDADGVHHVVWTQGSDLLYASNAGGSFSEPAEVARGSITGLSVTAADDGTPWVAFVDELSGAEGPVALVRVAHPTGEAWLVDTAAEADPPSPITTGIGTSGDEVMVAYGDTGGTMLARGTTTTGVPWTSEVADADGGYGVSMTTDADGNPHLAYYASDGEVRHAHSVDGAAWEVTREVALGGDAPAEGWSTAIDLAEDGVHHIAYKHADGIGYRSNAEGDFAGETWDGIANAVDPGVVAGPEGAVHVAWYDTLDAILTMATMSDEDPLLAVPAPEEEPTTAPTEEPTGPPPCEPEGTELQIAASGSVFDKDCLAAPAGEAFTIEFENQDQSVPHNVAIYTDSSAAEALFQGEVFPGPDTMVYEPDPIPDPGQYYFQCDVHPTMMGTFVVA